ncbi:MAG: phage holin family protein [Paraclostridium sp.]
MDLINFIPEQLFSLIAALYVLGMLFKSSRHISDELIPFMLLSIGVVASISLVGFNTEGIIQGILCTGMAIGINQTVKQAGKLRE